MFCLHFGSGSVREHTWRRCVVLCCVITWRLLFVILLWRSPESSVRFLLHSHSSPPQVFPLILKAVWVRPCLIKPPSLSCCCTCSLSLQKLNLISSCFSPERQPDQMSEQTEWLETPAWLCRAFHLICYSFLLSANLNHIQYNCFIRDSTMVLLGEH